MKLFRGEIIRNRVNCPFPFDPETGLYGRNFFMLRIKEERERSRRTNSPFSALVLDVDGIWRTIKGVDWKWFERSDRNEMNRLIKSIMSVPRKTDVKGWWNTHKAAIFMPDTDTHGARMVKDKICAVLTENELGNIRKEVERLIAVAGASTGERTGERPGHNQGNQHEEDRDIFEMLTDSRLGTNMLSSITQENAKRLLDIVGALFGLLIGGIPMLAIAVLIKLTSPGPALFQQERVGFRGRRFVLLKFRTMVVNADDAIHKEYVTGFIRGENGSINKGSAEEPVYKLRDDPRISSIGSLLRKTSLDELPQLFNVLKGEMSLVGPRPPLPYEVENYRAWHLGRINDVKPGLTGLWQVSGRSQTCFDDMVRLDLRYAQRWTVGEDIKIIVKTVGVLVSADGAY